MVIIINLTVISGYTNHISTIPFRCSLYFVPYQIIASISLTNSGDEPLHQYALV